MKEKIHGFLVIREKELPEISAVLHEMEHEQTGAKLVWLEQDEENKTFGIAFTTLPEDSTGIFHILEHSVLCGSDRYPVKEPFVELMKNSTNTFLNAMTFPDKTFYPISSRNNKDFLNLMRVYLDAVFYPAIYRKPEIFLQEGWRIEPDEEGKAAYQGVVFNEMKGAFADVDELTARAINEALFPDSPYRFESGGDPEHIPDLTYEQFLDGHRRFYSPTNSFIYLAGDLDPEEVLGIMDEEYLSRLPRGQRVAPPALQPPVNGGTRELEYEISADEPLEGKTRLVWGGVVGDFDDRERLTAARVLSDALCGSNQAPLTRAVLSSGLAEDVTLDFGYDGIAQPWWCLEVLNLEEENLPEVERILRKELEHLAEEGLDREQLEAIQTNLEFQMRERDYGAMPQGLVYGIQVLESWLYGGAPEANLEVGSLFDGLREKLKEGYYEQLIRDLLLENPHSCKVILKPSHTAGEARRAREQERLDRETAGWSAEEQEKNRKELEILSAWQNSEDTPEQLATLPHLALEDLPQEPEKVPLEVRQAGQCPVLYHQLDCSGIVYVTLYFNAEDCSEEEFSALSFLCGLFGETATEEHDAETLIKRARLLCGSMHFDISGYIGELSGKNRIKLTCSFSTLERNLEETLDLAAELFTETTLEEETDVREILRQDKEECFQEIVMSGNGAAVRRLSAQTSATGVADDCIRGISMYQWIKKQDENWDWPGLQSQLRGLRDRIFCRSRLTVSVTGADESLAETAAEKLTAKLPAGTDTAGESCLSPWGKRKEGIIIPADISFAVRGGTLSSYSGATVLASRIIRLAYLWNVIRVQGGAYGTGMTVHEDGFLACHSYRDPDAARSLERYLDCGEFLRQFCAEDPDLTGFIIGAVSEGSPLMTPRLKGAVADSFYWREITWETRCLRRRQLLSAKPEELIGIAGEMEQVLSQGGICVIGGQAVLDGCEGLDQVMVL